MTRGSHRRRDPSARRRRSRAAQMRRRISISAAISCSRWPSSTAHDRQVAHQPRELAVHAGLLGRREDALHAGQVRVERAWSPMKSLRAIRSRARAASAAISMPNDGPSRTPPTGRRPPPRGTRRPGRGRHVAVEERQPGEVGRGCAADGLADEGRLAAQRRQRRAVPVEGDALARVEETSARRRSARERRDRAVEVGDALAARPLGHRARVGGAAGRQLDEGLAAQRGGDAGCGEHLVRRVVVEHAADDRSDAAQAASGEPVRPLRVHPVRRVAGVANGARPGRRPGCRARAVTVAIAAASGASLRPGGHGQYLSPARRSTGPRRRCPSMMKSAAGTPRPDGHRRPARTDQHDRGVVMNRWRNGRTVHGLHQ